MTCPICKHGKLLAPKGCFHSQRWVQPLVLLRKIHFVELYIYGSLYRPFRGLGEFRLCRNTELHSVLKYYTPGCMGEQQTKSATSPFGVYERKHRNPEVKTSFTQY